MAFKLKSFAQPDLLKRIHREFAASMRDAGEPALLSSFSR